MNTELKNTREFIVDENSMSLESKCKKLEEKIRKLEELNITLMQCYVKAQNSAFNYSERADSLQKELDEIKYPCSQRVRHLQILRG